MHDDSPSNKDLLDKNYVMINLIVSLDKLHRPQTLGSDEGKFWERTALYSEPLAQAD